MKKLLRSFFLVATLTFLITSCSIYHPQAADIPLINHSGDTRVDASLGVSYWILPSTFTLNATVSHGFSDWLAGQVHGNFGGDNFYLQGAPGVYRPLGAHSVLEGYAGVGFGGAWRNDVESSSESSSNNNYSYKGTYLLPFGQVNIGWHDLSPLHIDLAIGLKAGAYMPNFNYHELDNNGDIIATSNYDYTTTNLLFEPQVMLRLGGEHIKFNIKVGYAWLSDIYGDNSHSKNLYSDLVTASAGLTFFF